MTSICLTLVKSTHARLSEISLWTRMNEFFISRCKSFQYYSSSRSLWEESCVVKWNEHEKKCPDYNYRT